MRDIRLWLAMAAVVLGGGLISFQLRSDNRSAPVDESELETAVFVCRESGELFVGKVRPTPALHPTSGKATLLPGLYDVEHKRWVTAPPFEQQQRLQQSGKQAARLLRQGPIPDSAIRI